MFKIQILTKGQFDAGITGKRGGPASFSHSLHIALFKLNNHPTYVQE